MNDHSPQTDSHQDEAPSACSLNPNKPCSRRTFIKGALAGVGVLWTGMTIYPIIKYLGSSGGSEEAEQVSSVSLGAPDTLAPNSAKNFKFGSQPAIIYRDAAGAFHAFSAVCTHLGCTVQYKEDKQKIYCACHGGTYEPATGKNIAGPPPKPLKALAVAVVKNEIVGSRA